jgi:type I restriction enzyme M protein
MANATNPNLGKLIDAAMTAIEKENPKQFRAVLPKIYARSNLDHQTLGEIINLFSAIGFGTEDAISKDILGRVYEYFIGRFAQQDISIFGQESIDTTWKICRMNLTIRGIEGNIQPGNSYWDDKHKDLRTDYILTNPPFNDTEWGAERVVGDVRLKYGMPGQYANYMWIQHFIYHLAPDGFAGFVMANGALSVSGQDGEIRRKIIENDLVDCIIALPVQLFYTTGIPACLWFVTKNKAQKRHRDRREETLFIDARKMFRKVDRTHNELTDEHIKTIADAYHAYRGEEGLPEYEDIPGFCKVAMIDEIRKNGYVLTPGRYVGTEEVEGDGEPLEEKMERLTAELVEQFDKSEELKDQIKKNLAELGYEL